MKFKAAAIFLIISVTSFPSEQGGNGNSETVLLQKKLSLTFTETAAYPYLKTWTVNGDSRLDKTPSSEALELYSKGLELTEIDPWLALEFFLEALAAEPDYAEAHVKTGWLFSSLGLKDEAVLHIVKAEDILNSRGYADSAAYAKIINDIAVVYRSLGDNDKALDYYQKSQKIRENLGLAETSAYAETSSNMGIVYVDTGRYGKALEYYFESLKIMSVLNLQNTAEYAVLLNNIGGAYWSTGNNDMALKYYLHSREIRDSLELQNTAGYAYLMNNIGSVYWRKGESGKAVLYYIRSQEIRDWLGLQNTESYAALMSSIAIAYYKGLDDPCKGEEYMKKCVETGARNRFLRLSWDLRDYREIQQACAALRRPVQSEK